MSLRLRLAVSALLISWALAALFIVLGWRESRTATVETTPTAVRSQATQLAPPTASF